MNVTKDCKQIYVGNTPIQKVYAGTNLVWSSTRKINLGSLANNQTIYLHRGTYPYVYVQKHADGEKTSELIKIKHDTDISKVSEKPIRYESERFVIEQPDDQSYGEVFYGSVTRYYWDSERTELCYSKLTYDEVIELGDVTSNKVIPEPVYFSPNFNVRNKYIILNDYNKLYITTRGSIRIAEAAHPRQTYGWSFPEYCVDVNDKFYVFSEPDLYVYNIYGQGDSIQCQFSEQLSSFTSFNSALRGMFHNPYKQENVIFSYSKDTVSYSLDSSKRKTSKKLEGFYGSIDKVQYDSFSNRYCILSSELRYQEVNLFDENLNHIKFVPAVPDTGCRILDFFLQGSELFVAYRDLSGNLIFEIMNV